MIKTTEPVFILDIDDDVIQLDYNACTGLMIYWSCCTVSTWTTIKISYVKIKRNQGRKTEMRVGLTDGSIACWQQLSLRQ